LLGVFLLFLLGGYIASLHGNEQHGNKE